MELEQQPVSQELIRVTQEALSEREQKMQGALSDPEKEPQDEARLVGESTDLGGLVVPAL